MLAREAATRGMMEEAAFVRSAVVEGVDGKDF
jgi:hypothetical protein